jgi:hypothetical protein
MNTFLYILFAVPMASLVVVMGMAMRGLDPRRRTVRDGEVGGESNDPTTFRS